MTERNSDLIQKETQTAEQSEIDQIGQAYQERLNAFHPRILAVGDWSRLAEVDPGAEVVSCKIDDAMNKVVEALLEGRPIDMIFCELNQDTWGKFEPLFILKSMMSVPRLGEIDQDALRRNLIKGLEKIGIGAGEGDSQSDQVADQVAQNPRSLPYLVARIDEGGFREKMRNVGGVDSVVGAEDDLGIIYPGIKSAVYARRVQPDFWQHETIQRTLVGVQQEIDLMALEARTTNTRACLEQVFEAFRRHEAETGQRIETVVEAGMGEGRIAIPLLLTGYNVIGMELNDARIATAQNRLLAEARHFVTGNPPEDSLARVALDLIPEEDREARIADIQQRLQELKEDYYGFPPYGQARIFMADRFHTMSSSFVQASAHEIRFATKMREDREPQAVISTWNTLNFAGSPEQMTRALTNFRNVLPPGGLLLIETADRTTGPYPDILQEYTEIHPQDIPGTTVSRPPSEGDTLYVEEGEGGVRRYFPSEEEMIHLLRVAGFEGIEVGRYQVVPQGEDFTPADQERLAYDELVFTARRPGSNPSQTPKRS